MAQGKSTDEKVVATNRLASHNYFLLDRFEAGLELLGTEVKSLRAGEANLRDSYVAIKDGQAWLLNCHIPPYAAGGYSNHAPLRARRLLLHGQEIRKLFGKTREKGLTLVPLKIYFKRGRAKCEIALAKGKKIYDKRETIRRRAAEREAAEAMRRHKRF
ncbi:MAG TPA: SsrA-binding protein SmpB [Candidatus Acidoferrales bacterium]